MKLKDLLKVIHIDEEMWIYDYNAAKWNFYTCSTKVDDKHIEKTVVYISTNGEGTLEIYIK